MYEIFRGKQRVFYTESEKCLPDEKMRKEMVAAGYRFLKDGKVMRGDKNGKL